MRSGGAPWGAQRASLGRCGCPKNKQIWPRMQLDCVHELRIFTREESCLYCNVFSFPKVFVTVRAVGRKETVVTLRAVVTTTAVVTFGAVVKQECVVTLGAVGYNKR